ncbi:hypothetical protein [Novosphingobium pentaromativorans]|uniref:Uncharacterized protein n=1 Tax=Novosphingobium pentaromativorans US6-1 TaxID=1088721 RepID=G6E8R6_9SPHN|nr:hypothetical protein [Novosphingobium pentaromativorans]AIT81251.1 hypothetical protein JI59_16430 [Novosphingobium pentaromativorans US6-1]EHJ62140.1 hypothetical protein NSU_0737 [Novosphingobium pentaromativorans US6-1]
MRHSILRAKYRINHLVGEVGRKLVRWSQRDSNYLKHARSEWAIAFPRKGDELADKMQRAIGENVLDMVAMFGLEGHSGSSASYAQTYIEKALKFEPFSPLTGHESEWMDIAYGGLQQNKRCGHVFREDDGKAYDINGRVFIEPSGAAYTSRDSRVYVEFPYVPTTEYVRVEEAA